MKRIAILSVILLASINYAGAQKKYLKQYEMIFGTWEVVAFCNLEVDIPNRSFVEEYLPSYFKFGDKNTFAALGHYDWGAGTWEMVNALLEQTKDDSPLIIRIYGDDGTFALGIVQNEMKEKELDLAIGATIFKLKKMPIIIHSSIGSLMPNKENK